MTVTMTTVSTPAHGGGSWEIRHETTTIMRMNVSKHFYLKIGEASGAVAERVELTFAFVLFQDS